MEAQAWTAIALLAATLAAWWYLLVPRIKEMDARIEELGRRLEARIDEASALLNAEKAGSGDRSSR